MARASWGGRTAARIALGLTIALAWLCAPGRAVAERVVAAPPRVSGAAAPSLREGFDASLAGGLAAAGHDAVDTATRARALRDTPTLSSCDTDTCLSRLAQLVGAGAVLRTAVEVLGSSNYSFRLDLYDASAHKVVASVEDTCTVCTVREANDALSRAAATLARRLPAASPAVAAPPTPVATTTRAAPPRRVATVSTPRSRLFLGLGVTSLVLGLGAAGGGAALIALDGRVTDVPVSAGMPQIDTLHTLVPGAILTAAGGLLVVGGGILLWRSQVARRPQTIQP